MEVKQVKLTKRSASAMQAAIAHLNQLVAVAQGARAVADVAVKAAQEAQHQVVAASTTHEQHIAPYIEDAGYKLEDFQRYGLWTDPESGEQYLRAAAQQQ